MIGIKKIIEIIKVGYFVYQLAHNKKYSEDEKIIKIKNELEELYTEIKGK